MFTYMDERIRGTAYAISLDELYELFLGRTAKYLALAKWSEDNRFWSDECKRHFGITPFDSSQAKSFFQAGYLFAKQNFKEAAKQNSFHALDHYYKNYLNENNYIAALQIAEQITKYYGLVGLIITLNIYQSVSTAKPQEAGKHAQSALEVLKRMDALDADPASKHYFVEISQAQINSEYGSLAEFKEIVRETFEEYGEKIAPSP